MTLIRFDSVMKLLLSHYYIPSPNSSGFSQIPEFPRVPAPHPRGHGGESAGDEAGEGSGVILTGAERPLTRWFRLQLGSGLRLLGLMERQRDKQTFSSLSSRSFSFSGLYFRIPELLRLRS